MALWREVFSGGDELGKVRGAHPGTSSLLLSFSPLSD
jgi:hypothetical protein